MKLPRLPVLAVTALSLAMVTGMSATAASAANAPATGISSASSAKPEGHLTAPVTGTFRNSTGRGTFRGAFDPTKFTVVNGALQATGLLTGELSAGNGTSLGTVHRIITTTVDTGKADAAPPVCSILNLKLGPLNLNLLGLNVHLNRIHLTITAIPGIGNLLGNLLCSIANLLNGGGSLTQIATLLNRVLALL
jgi:hypothetical protein